MNRLIAAPIPANTLNVDRQLTSADLPLGSFVGKPIGQCHRNNDLPFHR